MATASNGSFASPLADAKYAQIIGHPQLDGLLGRLGELSGWQIALTLLLVLVAYDQCKPFACQAPLRDSS
jgi:C-22 sterol desaturase